MKVSSWQNIILSWANALKILDEPVSDILDLVKGNFFVRLLNKIKNGEADFLEVVSEGDVYDAIKNFLNDQYGGFRLLGYWDNDEVTLVSSVLLLWASLQSQDFRTPLFDLNTVVQLKIHAFLEQFVEIPQHHINRQIVMEAVLDIPSDDETDDSSSYISSPRTYSTPKSGSCYSPGFLALSEVRSLRGKMELLSFEKQHLQDELESTKSQLIDTIAKLDNQKSEYSRLSNMMLQGEENKDLFREKGDGDSYGRSRDESVMLKLDLEELKDVHAKLRQELDSTLKDNNNLSQKLSIEEKKRMNTEHKSLEMESKIVSLTKKNEELEALVSSLQKTCEEQRDILEERRNMSKEESFHFTDGETLDSVIDIKYSELQEELKLQEEILEEKSNEIKKLLNEKANDQELIKKLTEEVQNIASLSKTEEKVSQCNMCQNIKEELATLKKDFDNKDSEILKLQETLEEKKMQLKLLNNNKMIDEAHIEELKSNVNSLISMHNMKCNELREEIVALKCDICEKNNNIDYYKDEIDFLNCRIKERNLEMKTLEEDYNKINSSKDREIAQLMVTIEHLNREVKRFEDQLQDQYIKNEKLVHSAFQWRQKMTHGDTANEELARELISLHEILEWKNFKLKEFSLQMEQLKSEISDKAIMNKELHDRLSFMSDRNKEYFKELQESKNKITQLKSKLVTTEFNEKKLNQDNNANIKKINLLEFELRELRKRLQEKFIQIESELESHILKGNFGVQELLQFVDFLIVTLKENKKKIKILNQVITGLENDFADKSFDLEHCKAKIEQLSVENSVKSKEEIWIRENEEMKDKLIKIENEFENNKVKLQIYLNKLEIANDEANEKDAIISELKIEIEKLQKEQIEKKDLIDHLTQNVNLYEHEKNILEKRLKNLTLKTGETESVKAENMVLKNDVVILEKQLEEERETLKTVEEQIDLEDKLNRIFEEKLILLQTKMRQQHEEDMNNMAEEYSKKIEQLKIKIKKDCLHIEQLSSDLWETSDRLVLAQQESEALRSQLRMSRQRMTDYQMQKRGIEDTNSFMWLGGIDAANFIDEMVTTVTTKRTIQAARADDDDDFSQQCLEDLKAGICRIPSERLSCPPSASSSNEENTFLPPPEKPRKQKGAITYRKPGPPTPSISAARHSLPGTDKLDHKRGLRENNTNSGQARSRLSQIFGSINLSKTKAVQESPKVKRKGFFQRTFGNRENIPPN